jgi:hypothetical protein
MADSSQPPTGKSRLILPGISPVHPLHHQCDEQDRLREQLHKTESMRAAAVQQFAGLKRAAEIAQASMKSMHGKLIDALTTLHDLADYERGEEPRDAESAHRAREVLARVVPNEVLEAAKLDGEVIRE